jgi:hypothetical protein
MSATSPPFSIAGIGASQEDHAAWQTAEAFPLFIRGKGHGGRIATDPARIERTGRAGSLATKPGRGLSASTSQTQTREPESLTGL